MGQYSKLITVRVEHQYFGEDAGPAMQFVPSHETASLIHRTGLLVRSTPQTLGVFADQSRPDALQMEVRDSKDPVNLTFKAYATDSGFQNYTVPLIQKSAGTVFFFENVKSAGTLHEADFVSEKDFRNINELGQFPGLLNRGDLMVPPDLVVRIELKKEDFTAGSSFRVRDYRIRFESRQTIWKYYLLGNFKKGVPGIADVSNQTEFEFTGKASLPGERTAFTFRSKTPIPLREQYDFRFQLRNKSVSGGKVLIRRLPVASSSQFGKEIIDGREVIVSEIYINY